MAVLESEIETTAGPVDAEFIWWFARVRKALRHEIEQRLEPFGLTVPQFMTLRRLWVGDGLPISTLAAEVNSVGGTMTGVLDRLECRGYLRRERSSDDRRAVRIYLTDAGRSLEPSLNAVVQAVERLALSRLSVEERGEIVRLLRRVGESFDGR